jgi:hypothetical protein
MDLTGPKSEQKPLNKPLDEPNGNFDNKYKTYYVEESVKILENIIMKADPILTELSSKVG